MQSVLAVFLQPSSQADAGHGPIVEPNEEFKLALADDAAADITVDEGTNDLTVPISLPLASTALPVPVWVRALGTVGAAPIKEAGDGQAAPMLSIEVTSPIPSVLSGANTAAIFVTGAESAASAIVETRSHGARREADGEEQATQIPAGKLTTVLVQLEMPAAAKMDEPILPPDGSRVDQPMLEVAHVVASASQAGITTSSGSIAGPGAGNPSIPVANDVAPASLVPPLVSLPKGPKPLFLEEQKVIIPPAAYVVDEERRRLAQVEFRTTGQIHGTGDEVERLTPLSPHGAVSHEWDESTNARPQTAPKSFLERLFSSLTSPLAGEPVANILSEPDPSRQPTIESSKQDGFVQHSTSQVAAAHGAPAVQGAIFALPDPVGGAVEATTDAPIEDYAREADLIKRDASPTVSTTRVELDSQPRPILLPMSTADVTVKGADAANRHAEDSAPAGFSVVGPLVQNTGNSVVALSGQMPQFFSQMTTALGQSPDGETELALSPEELGRVRLQLKPDAGNPDRLVVMITFERPETLDLFRRHASELADAFRSAGYAGADIGFGQEGRSGADQDRGSHGPGHDRSSAHEPIDQKLTAPRLPAGVSLDLRL